MRPVRITRAALGRLIREEAALLREANASAAWREAIGDLTSALAAVQVLESQSGTSPLGPSAMKMVHDLHLAVTKMEGF